MKSLSEINTMILDNEYGMISGFVFIFCLLSACSNSKQRIEDDIKKLCSQRITIPYELFQEYKDNEKIETEKLTSPFKLIAYNDSNQCTTCAISHLDMWIPLLDSLASYEGKVEAAFIFSPKREDRTYLTHRLRLPFPIYVDSSYAFCQRNTHIPVNPMMHTFLLNEKDSVILVGDPVRNERIKKMLFDILKK